MIAVQYDGFVPKHILEFVPEEEKTEEICKIAVQQNEWALEYVPEEKKTEEICSIAMTPSPN